MVRLSPRRNVVTSEEEGNEGNKDLNGETKWTVERGEKDERFLAEGQ